MQARFDNPEWSVEGEYEYLNNRSFTQNGRDIIVSALKKTGKASNIGNGNTVIAYYGNEISEPFLTCSVTRDFKLTIHINHDETPNTIKFLDRLARNLSKALSREEPIGPPTKPIIPPGTMFERLPFEVEELIREFAVEPKNPLK